MTKQEIDTIRERSEKATPGAWSVDTNEPFSCQINGVFSDSEEKYIFYHDPDGEDTVNRNNANFIAHARTDIPALLDEVDRLQVECAALRSELLFEKRSNEAFKGTAQMVKDGAMKLGTVKKEVSMLTKALALACEFIPTTCIRNADVQSCVNMCIQKAKEGQSNG